MMKKYKDIVVAVLIGLLTFAPFQGVFGAASGNFTETLPGSVAGDTALINRGPGSGWAVATLPPTNTFGDSLSRSVIAIYQASSQATITGTEIVSTMTALSGQSSVGSTTYPLAWTAVGRSIRITIDGAYGSFNTTSTWKWDLNLGTNTVLTTGAIAIAGPQQQQTFRAIGLITIASTGTVSKVAGTANAHWDIIVSSNPSGVAGVGGNTPVVFSTTTPSAVTVDWTKNLTVNPRFAWGQNNLRDILTINNVIVELLN